MQTVNIRRKVKGYKNIRAVSRTRKLSRLKCAVYQSLKCPAYKVALHEVGHLVVKSQLKPEAIYKIELEITSNNEIVGRTIELSAKPGDIEPLNVAAAVSIAGVTAETHSWQAAYKLLTTGPQFFGKGGDFEFYMKARALQRNEMDSIGINNEEQYFRMLYREVKKHFRFVGLAYMDRQARNVLKAHNL